MPSSANNTQSTNAKKHPLDLAILISPIYSQWKRCSTIVHRTAKIITDRQIQIPLLYVSTHTPITRAQASRYCVFLSLFLFSRNRYAEHQILVYKPIIFYQ